MASPEEMALRILELTDRQDWAAREALLSPDCDLLTPTGQLWGRAATTAYSKPLVSAFGDARHQVYLVATSGNVVVLEGA